MNKRRNLKNIIERTIAKKHLKYVDMFNVEHEYRYLVETHNEAIYVKFFYDTDIPYSNVEKLYREAIEWFLKYDYRFQGITEYRGNREICLTFLKK